MIVDIAFWTQLLYLVAAVVVGFVLGKFMGWLVNKILDQTVERWLDKTRVGKELREIGLDFSDTVGLYTAVFIFLLFLSWGVKQVTIVHPWWQGIINLVDYAIILTLGFAFITVALLFVTFLADYFGRLVKGYREDVGELLKLLLLVGLVWVVVNSAMDMMNLGYTIVKDIMNGFVAFAVGWVIAEFVGNKLSEESEEFRRFSPYGKYVIFLIFLLVGLNAIFAKYLSTTIIKVLAWGVVFLFAAVLIPFVVKAVKEIL